MLTSYAALCVAAEDLSALHYRPTQSVSGTIRVWGNAQMRALVQRWGVAFRRWQPQAKLQLHMTGSDIGMAGLYTGRADLAVLGRASTDSETKAFEWIYGYRPLALQILCGSLDQAGRSPALVVFVHQSNPLAQLALAQLAAIFNDDSRSRTAAIRRWDQLGLRGEWANQAIHIYSVDTESGTGRFFRHEVLDDGRLLNWDNLTEFKDRRNSDGSVVTSRAQILGALARDRYGIALTSLPASEAGVRPIALGSKPGGSYYQATARSLIARRYPLSRAIFAYVNRRGAGPMEPKVREFLRFVLSRDGQSQVRARDGYLPLSAALAREQLQDLDGTAVAFRLISESESKLQAAAHELPLPTP
ncbi:MAG: substrate-binding domain-containing protein [Gammaproteobacteria bacterium]|nr:substrate-binding domain-containing protein [Gammaproteobacteria bacterium]